MAEGQEETMFREVKKEETFPQIEERVLALWDKDDSFKKSLDSRPATAPYTFYDGPPFATGLPHYGHLPCVSNTICLCLAINIWLDWYLVGNCSGRSAFHTCFSDFPYCTS